MHKVLGNARQGKLFIVSAPSGTGKTTLVKKLTKEFPCVIASISFTTRPPRNGEVDGVDYHFINDAEFEKKKEEDDFLEFAEVFGRYYGTSKKWVSEQLNQGKHVVLVIDTQGAMKLKKIISAVLIFVQPPNEEELVRRLSNRQTETPEKIEERLRWAKNEMVMSQYYDYLIVNDHLEVAYRVLKSIFIAEEHRIRS